MSCLATDASLDAPTQELPWWDWSGETEQSLLIKVIHLAKLLVGKTSMRSIRGAPVSACIAMNSLAHTMPEDDRLGNFDIYTSEALQETWNNSTFSDLKQPAKLAWNIDGSSVSGSSSVSSLTQCIQSIKALKFLCHKDSLDEPLSVEMLIEAHSIRMSGAQVRHLDTNEEENFRCGFRDSDAVSDSGYQYLQHESILELTEKFCEELNTITSQCEKFDTEVQYCNSEEADNSGLARGLKAADFAWQILIQQIHPFRDGNEKLGMILISRIVMQFGLDFPMRIDDGRYESKKHFQECICDYNTDRGSRWMYLYLIDCLHTNLQNLRMISEPFKPSIIRQRPQFFLLPILKAAAIGVYLRQRGLWLHMQSRACICLVKYCRLCLWCVCVCLQHKNRILNISGC